MPDDLELIEQVGPEGGPRFRYRSAEIHCNKVGAVCSLRMEGHPLDGIQFGAPGTITDLVDLWLTEQRLPHWLKAVPKNERRR
ncbi:hypothetical protein [Sabulicella glaciei]|uniref:Uncharacterized protein n=1 Tax=Sabulicella glaciei TaxID=2984948 RepID=A0ABT3NYV7_9PROT|nr:hypothetical protein [Roseococcus sp. MDT2-1-1]MCW8087316.1 hypothetical protein [Roseococcus sp. MDT2-1-1]